MPENKGPQGKPVSSLSFLEPAIAEAKPQADAAPQQQHVPQVVHIDSPEYAHAVVQAVQAQPDIAQLIDKLGDLNQALHQGHDVRVVVGELLKLVTQTVSVVAVKHLDAILEAQSDSDAVGAIEELADIHDSIREIIEKSTMAKVQKDEVLKLLDSADDITADFLEEDDEEDDA